MDRGKRGQKLRCDKLGNHQTLSSTFFVKSQLVNYCCEFQLDVDSQFRTALKTRAVFAGEPPCKIILSVQRDINRKTAAVITSYSANQRTVNRVKQEKRPGMQEY